MKHQSHRTNGHPFGSLALALLIAAAGLADASTPAPSPEQLPRLAIGDLEFAGAFRLPARKFGVSDMNFSQGPIAYNPDRRSLFVVGHAHQQAIAEFTIPELVDSSVPADLKIAGTPLQPFSPVLDRPAPDNRQNNNRIGGMLYVRGNNRPELLVNAYEYYDAPGDNTFSMLVMRDADDLAKCPVDGYFRVDGRPGHTAGWMSPVPAEWQPLLGGRFLAGHSSGIPIISRTSVGPSAFVFDPLDIVGRKSVADPIRTTKLLDFSLEHPLHEDLSNKSRKNRLWNHLSRAVYGIIIPGTRTYATFGHSGGNQSGVGYKNVRDDGSRSGGYSSYAVKDNYHYYWFWDVNDLVRVMRGEIKPHEVLPYEYGVFETPFGDASQNLGGGTFDPVTSRIYLTAQGADKTQGRYSNPPIVMAYKADIEPQQQSCPQFPPSATGDFADSARSRSRFPFPRSMLSFPPAMRPLLHILPLLCLLARPLAGAELPNILILYADDLGFGDLGCYNRESKIPTPHLDRLAEAPDVMMDTSKWKKIKEGNWECRPGPARSDWDPYQNIPTTTREGVEFIKAQKENDGPFFLYFAFPSPHAPIIPNDQFDGKSQAGPYGDFVHETDDACGKLLKALRDSDQEKDTLVIFTADNGPEKYAYARDQKFDHWSSKPLRGLKRDIYEGGHHVPFIVRWPEVVPAGRTEPALISQIDVFASVAAIVGYELPDNAAEDSHNQLPRFKGEVTASPIRTTHIHNTKANHYAIRHGDWLLVDAKTG
jgi:hypothetical protein